MKVLEERLVYLFTLFCKDLLCSCFHFGSRTFICMFNIFVFPPPSPIAFSFGVCGRVIYFFFTTHSMLMHFEMHAGFDLDDKAIIQVCTRIVCNSWQDSDQLVWLYHKLSLALQVYICISLSSFQIGDDLYQVIWGCSYISTAWFNGLTISTYPGCWWFHPWFALSGCFCCCFCCEYLWMISLQRPMDFSSHALMKFAISLIWESHIGLQSRALFFSADQYFSVNLQDNSLGVCGVFPTFFWLLFLVRFLYIPDGWFVPSG